MCYSVWLRRQHLYYDLSVGQFGRSLTCFGLLCPTNSLFKFPLASSFSYALREYFERLWSLFLCVLSTRRIQPVLYFGILSNMNLVFLVVLMRLQIFYCQFKCISSLWSQFLWQFCGTTTVQVLTFVKNYLAFITIRIGGNIIVSEIYVLITFFVVFVGLSLFRYFKFIFSSCSLF
jgi:hypothetical protein